MTWASVAGLIVLGAALGACGFYWLVLWVFLKHWRLK